jgi:hypothetical protein
MARLKLGVYIAYLKVAFQGTDMEYVEVVTRQSYKVVARVDGDGAQHTYTATPSSQLRDQSTRKLDACEQ